MATFLQEEDKLIVVKHQFEQLQGKLHTFDNRKKKYKIYCQLMSAVSGWKESYRIRAYALFVVAFNLVDRQIFAVASTNRGIDFRSQGQQEEHCQIRA